MPDARGGAVGDAPMDGAGVRATVTRLARRSPTSVIFVGLFTYAFGPVLVAASDTTGTVFAFWRGWFGAILFAVATAWSVWRGRTTWPSMRTLEGRHAWWLTTLGGLSFGVHQLFFFTAIKRTSVTDVVLLSTISPIIVAIAAIPLFGERTGARFRAWTLVAMVGTASIVTAGSQGPEGDPLGMFLALLSVLFYTGFFLASKQSRASMDVLPFLFGVLLIGSLLISVYLLIVGETVMDVTRRDLTFAFALAIGPGGVGHFIMTWPLRWLAANIPPLVRLAQPAITGFTAWAVLGQPILPVHFVGGAIILAGVTGALTSADGRAMRDTARETAASAQQADESVAQQEERRGADDEHEGDVEAPPAQP